MRTKLKVSQFVVSLAFEFAWTCTVKFSGKEFVKWSELRLELKRMVHAACKKEDSASTSSLDTSGTLQDVVNQAAATRSVTSP